MVARQKDKRGMEVDRQPGWPGKGISEEWKQTGSQATQVKGYTGNRSRQAARPARQKDKQGIEADMQPGKPGKSISMEWKQTGSQARQAKR